MAMLFEAAQSRGDDMQLLFMSFNLHFFRMGQVYNPTFLDSISDEFAHVSMGGMIPSYLFGLVLNEVYESGSAELTQCDDPEIITIYDSLFNLVSSGVYQTTTLVEKLDSALNTFGDFISYDISINVEALDIDDELKDEFEDIQYQSDDYTKLIKHLFCHNCLEFRIYNTEDLSLVLETLIDLKEVLENIQEELNEKNHRNVA